MLNISKVLYLSIVVKHTISMNLVPVMHLKIKYKYSLKSNQWKTLNKNL